MGAVGLVRAVVAGMIMCAGVIGLLATDAFAVANRINMANADASALVGSPIEITFTDGTTESTTIQNDGSFTTSKPVTERNVDKCFVVKKTSTGEEKREAVSCFILLGGGDAATAAAAGGAAAQSDTGSFLKQSEFYFNVLFGYTLSGELSDASGNGPLSLLRFSDIDLKNSKYYGGGLGMYSPKLFDWDVRAGIELRIQHNNPHFKGQVLSASFDNIPLGEAPVPGLHFRQSSVPLLFLLRGDWWPWVQPYAGLGPGLYFGHVSDSQSSASDTSLGWIAVAGLRIKTPIQHLGLWFEYSRDWMNFDFALPIGVSGDYCPQAVKFGIGLHF